MDNDGADDFEAKYDYRTRRIWKKGRNRNSVNEQSVFRYDGGTSFDELDGSTGLTRVVLTRGGGMGGGIGSVLYNVRDGVGTEYFTNNAVGHTVALTNDAGAVTKTDLYEAFGSIVESTHSGTLPSTNNRLANTKERDFSTGLDNHGFRYYDPIIGRYISRDPIGYGDGMNVYLYVRNNPINFYDPEGLGYWGDVGKVWVGYGRSVKATVVGVYTLVRHPVQSAKGIGHAVVHPVQAEHTKGKRKMKKGKHQKGQKSRTKSIRQIRCGNISAGFV